LDLQPDGWSELAPFVPFSFLHRGAPTTPCLLPSADLRRREFSSSGEDCFLAAFFSRDINRLPGGVAGFDTYTARSLLALVLSSRGYHLLVRWLVPLFFLNIVATPPPSSYPFITELSPTFPFINRVLFLSRIVNFLPPLRCLPRAHADHPSRFF